MALIVRTESFGAIVGDNAGYGFRVVNRAGLAALRSLSTGKVDSNVGLSKDGPATRAFVDRIQELGWLDGGRFSGRFIDNGNRVPFLSAPIRVWLEVTSRCNLSCPQCFNENHRDFLTPDLPEADIKRIVASLAAAGVLQVTITGGEPLLRRDIFSILDAVRLSGMGLRFFTNGTVMTEALADKLANYDITHLFLSLDGMPAPNDLLRGRDTFRRILAGLAILAKSRTNITLSTTLHRYSLDSIPELFRLAQQYGVRSMLIRPLFEYRPTETRLALGPADLDDLVDRLELASSSTGVEYQLNKLPFRPLKKTVFIHDNPSDVHLSYFAKHNKFGCVGGNSVVGIKANGVIMACGFVPHHYDAGDQHNVLSTPFLDLWNRSSNVTVLRDIAANETCRGCGLLNVCGGGCRANALMNSGRLDGVDPHCYWIQHGISRPTQGNDVKDETDSVDPYLSDRTIVTKCGSGSLL